jgi:fibronectin type 3 domain-containing protein
MIVDSIVIGLGYTSTSQDGKKVTGYTNSKGEFQYFENGLTRFNLGNIEIAATKPSPFLAIDDIEQDLLKKQNIARFLQTLDDDLNPGNGIYLTASVSQNASSISQLRFDENFDADFEKNKKILFGSGNVAPALVSPSNAIAHAAIANNLSANQSLSLFKAISNQAFYPSSYNVEKLTADQQKRLHLWIWLNYTYPLMATEDDLKSQEFDPKNIEKDYERYKRIIDITSTFIDLLSIGAGGHDILKKFNNRSFIYNFTNVSALSYDMCKAEIKILDLNDQVIATSEEKSLCEKLKWFVNPGYNMDGGSKFAGELSSKFMREAIPIIVKNYKMNYLHLNGKYIYAPEPNALNYISMALDIATAANALTHAHQANTSTREITNRIIAREWLNIYHQSGHDRSFMNKQLSKGASSITSTYMEDQIKHIANQLGQSTLYCDAINLVTPGASCKNVNYDFTIVRDIINSHLQINNSMYSRLTAITGPLYDANANVGVASIDFDQLLQESNIIPVTINGYVLDENGSAIADASITTSIDNSSTKTNERGYFSLATATDKKNYKNKPYSINISAPIFMGYEAYTKTKEWGDSPSGLSFTLLKKKAETIKTPTFNGNLSHENKAWGIKLNWPIAENATEYQLYRSENATSDGKQIYKGKETNFNDINPLPNIIFFYVVKACNEKGCTKSNIVSDIFSKEATTSEKPVLKGGVNIVKNTHSLKLNWNAASGVVDSYELYRAPDNTSTGTKVYSGNTTSFEDTNVSKGVTYYYYARACNSGGCAASNRDYGTLPEETTVKAPALNSGVNIVKNTNSFKLNWNAASGTVDYYELYRALNSSSTGTRIYSGNATAFEDANVSKGVTYYYYARACNSGGCAESKRDYGTLPEDSAPKPVLTGGVNIVKNTNSFKLNWNTASGVADFYELYRATDSTSTGSRIYTGNVTNYEDSDVSKSITYYYYARACNASGCTSSNRDYGTLPDSLPAPVMSGGVNIKSITKGFALNWRKASGVVEHYELWRSTSSTSNGIRLYIGTDINHDDTIGLKSETTYYYYAKACNSSGCSSSNRDYKTY